MESVCYRTSLTKVSSVNGEISQLHAVSVTNYVSRRPLKAHVEHIRHKNDRGLNMKPFSFSLPLSAMAVASLALATNATAQFSDPETQRYLGVMGTYSIADDDRGFRLRELGLDADTDEAVGVSVLYGWQFPSNFGLEIQGFSETIETDVPGITDFYRHGLTADFVYSFGDRTSFTPFLLIGGGGAYNDVSPNKDKFDFIANAGVGFVTGPVLKYGSVRIRGEARYQYDNFERNYKDIRFALGVEIPLFGEPEPFTPPPAQEQVRVVEVPTGLLDDDGDGVINDVDQCPDTPPNTRVDGVGCPLGDLIALNGVTFEFDKTRLRPDAETILDLATKLLKKYPDMDVEVAGHTDSQGAEGYNQKLSEGRAAAVRDYFISKGVTNTLTVRGYGEAEPIADNATAEGRERNRRVELRILN